MYSQKVNIHIKIGLYLMYSSVYHNEITSGMYTFLTLFCGLALELSSSETKMHSVKNYCTGTVVGKMFIDF